MQLNTPVTIFIFKRADKFDNLISQLKNVKPKKLFIIGDGPRKDSDVQMVEETRKRINNINWDCDIYTNFSDKNLGGPVRIPSGLNWVFEHVDSSIILEDDILPHTDFFQYAEEMLFTYKYYENIGHIAGNNPTKVGKKIKESYFFAPLFRVWGWATWKRAWDKFDPGMSYIKQLLQDDWLERILSHQQFANKWRKILYNVLNGRRSISWDLAWYCTCWANNMLAIYPRNNLIDCFGSDIHAQHSGQVSTPFDKIPVSQPLSFPLRHPESVTVKQEFVKKCFQRKNSAHARLTKKLYRLKNILMKQG